MLSLGVAAPPVSIEIAARLRPPVSLEKVRDTSPLLLSQSGKWVDAMLSADDKWRFGAGGADVPKLYVDLLLAYEDHRFYLHSGISYRAVLRAALSAVRHGKVVSGASTLPMQVVRLAEGQEPGLLGKVQQAIGARRLVLDHSPDEILGFYLTLAPFGGNLEGVEAAALHYFGTRARELGLDQVALLVAIPQAPESRRLDRHPDAARAARERVLARGVVAGIVTPPHSAELAATPIRVQPSRSFGHAHTLLRHIQQQEGAGTSYTSTLHADLQDIVLRDLQAALAEKPVGVNAAALVVRNADGSVLAHVANARSFADPAGYLDLTTRLRSPGSALKPFFYAMAFDEGYAHPNTRFYDRPQRYGAFSPRNFGDSPQGPIPLREALASSLNTAAVAVMNEVGAQRFVNHLRATGTTLALPSDDKDAGLAVSLGGLGISLMDLTGLYVALANQGHGVALRKRMSTATRAVPIPVTGEGAAWAVTDALAGARPPDGETPLKALNGALRLAYKTGTSSGRRDVWAVGYDRLHTVAVWIGRPDNGGMPGASGRHTAAPILWQVFRALPAPEQGVIRKLPQKDAYLGWDTPPARLRELGSDAGAVPLAIQFPQRGGLVKLPEGAEKVTFTLSGGEPPYSWIINDVLTPTSFSQHLTLAVEKGPLSIIVLDRKGARDALETWVE